MIINNLSNTTEMMESTDYKERFKGEYYQLVYRYKKLLNMYNMMVLGDLNFTPKCPRSTYNLQLKVMSEYIAILEARALIEGIILEEVIVEQEEMNK